MSDPINRDLIGLDEQGEPMYRLERRERWGLIFVLLVCLAAWTGLLLVFTGCAALEKLPELARNLPAPDSTEPPPAADPPAQPALPVNPAIAPDPAEGRGERWDFGRKAYDSTWRIRFPSTLGRPPHNVGAGSWCTVNAGARAEFRSFDLDHGAKRPSYTMPLSTSVAFPATVILHDASGKPVAWFRADAADTNGRLP